MAGRTLNLEMAPPLAFLRLGQAEVDDALLAGLDAACAAVNDDATIRVAVISAEGDDFSTGWAAAALDRDPASRPPPFACLESMRQPAVCAIHGRAVSAGLELALACDVRIASGDATFALPDTAQGRLPIAGGTQRLARLVGRGEALRLLLLAEAIDAAEALRIGLVSAVVPRASLDAEADALARTIASRGPIAVAYAKEAVRRGLELPIDEALRYETDLTVLLQTTADRAEGVRAFLEKREPEFEGR